jgi:transcriptional regulator with XRE-family HTH domain
LAELSFKKGKEYVQKEFQRLLSVEETGEYQIIKSKAGKPAQRTDVERSKDHISYLSFNPPPFWETPYNVLKATFHSSKRPLELIYHGGEEILVPTAGKISYQFCWAGPGKGPEDIQETVNESSLIRINPQIPHHTWAADAGPTEAWMIFRHWSAMTAAINVDAGESEHLAWRRMRAADLKQQPWRYALIAWGLSERIRVNRSAAGLSCEQVAKDCGITPSHLSRIERAEANVSIDTLIKLVRYLGVDIRDLVGGSNWLYKIAKRPAGKAACAKMLRPPSDHFLHLTCHQLRQNGTVQCASDSNADQTIIALQGRMILEVGTGNGETRLDVLEPGDVAHFRKHVSVSLKAWEDSTVLQVTYSAAAAAVKCDCANDEEQRWK